MPQIRPITDLRNTNEISDICHKQNEPIFITKNGYGDLVIVSIETYEHRLALVEVYKSLLRRKHSLHRVFLCWTEKKSLKS